MENPKSQPEQSIPPFLAQAQRGQAHDPQLQGQNQGASRQGRFPEPGAPPRSYEPFQQQYPASHAATQDQGHYPHHHAPGYGVQEPAHGQGPSTNHTAVPHPPPGYSQSANVQPGTQPTTGQDYQPSYKTQNTQSQPPQHLQQGYPQAGYSQTQSYGASPSSPYHPAPHRSQPPRISPHRNAQDRLVQERRMAAAGKPVRRARQDDYDDFVPHFKAQEPYKPHQTDYRFWVLGGVLLVGLTILIEPTRVISSIVKTQEYDCQEVVQPQSVLSRDQLTQLLAIPERAAKEQVRNVIREPYCLLPSIKIRAGVSAVREAYPLESDPDTWVVMLYEGDEYAGYRFNAR